MRTSEVALHEGRTGGLGLARSRRCGASRRTSAPSRIAGIGFGLPWASQERARPELACQRLVDLAADEALARQLRVSWSPFFGRHGRLRPIQRNAMPAILEGADVLVIAPTASGKTEAACAPLVERNFARPHWTILYVSPTRALVNDLFERLAGPIEQMGLTIRRRTGDHHDPLDQVPNLLLTTPESFDSLLCRGRRTDGDHVLGYVEAVVLDEVHLIYGTARGEQVRWLLRRLEKVRAQMEAAGKLRSHAVQVVALSATVPDAVDVAAAYLSPGSSSATAGGAREIEVVAPAVDRPDAEAAIPGFVLAEIDPQKLLVFSNSRKRVDYLARELAKTLAPSPVHSPGSPWVSRAGRARVHGADAEE